MIVIIILAALIFICYSTAAWHESRSIEPSERTLHAVFRIGPLLALGLLAVATVLADEPEPIELAAVDTPIVIARVVKRLTIDRPDLLEQTIDRIRCQRRTVPIIERWGRRTIIVRC